MADDAGLKQEIAQLKEQVKRNREGNQNTTVAKSSEGVAALNGVSMKQRRTLK